MSRGVLTAASLRAPAASGEENSKPESQSHPLLGLRERRGKSWSGPPCNFA